MVLNKEKIQENFEEFMFYIDDTLDAIKQKANKQGYHLDMSLESLKDLAQFVRENDVKNDPENVDDFFNSWFGFSAFVFKNLWGSNLLKTSIVAFMSGSLIPLTFFPKLVSDILSFLPFSSLIYTPVMIIVGKYDANQMLQALALQFFWLLVMVGLSQFIWKRVQSFITIQGG